MFLAIFYFLHPNLQAASASSSPVKKLAPVSAYDKAKAHFNANFAGVKDAVWYNLPNDDIVCTFHKGKAITRVFYNNRGNWQYTLLSYPGSGLSVDLKHRVQDYFDNYHIDYVNEIRSENADPVYVMDLENEGHIKVVRVDDDNIDVQQELYKE